MAGTGDWRKLDFEGVGGPGKPITGTALDLPSLRRPPPKPIKVGERR